MHPNHLLDSKKNQSESDDERTDASFSIRSKLPQDTKEWLSPSTDQHSPVNATFDYSEHEKSNSSQVSQTFDRIKKRSISHVKNQNIIDSQQSLNVNNVLPMSSSTNVYTDSGMNKNRLYDRGNVSKINSINQQELNPGQFYLSPISTEHSPRRDVDSIQVSDPSTSIKRVLNEKLPSNPSAKVDQSPSKLNESLLASAKQFNDQTK